jgi:hypothetical protein
MASLVLGIAGLVTFVYPAGFGLVFVINLPCSVLAWVFGVQAMRADDPGSAARQRSRAQAGKVIGIVGVILGVLAIVAWGLAIGLDDELRHRLIHELEKSNR